MSVTGSLDQVEREAFLRWCYLSCKDHLFGLSFPKMKLHPKGWSSEDYSVKIITESLLFQSLKVSQQKDHKSKQSFHRFTWGKKRNKKVIIPHTSNWPLLPLSSIYWLGLYVLLIHTKDKHMKTTGCKVKNYINHLLLLSISKCLGDFFHFIDTNAHFCVMPTQPQLNA